MQQASTVFQRWPWRITRRSRAGLLLWLGLAVVLVVVLLERFLYYQEQVERAVMEATIVHIRSGMRWHMADLMTRQKSIEVAMMLEQNPILWLQQPPVNYFGALDAGAAMGALRSGAWYFDTQRHELLYIPRLHRFFAAADSANQVRFKVQASGQVAALDHQSGGQLSGGAGGENSARAARVERVDIVPVRPYKWF